MEAISRLAKSTGVSEVWYVDQTPDGVFNPPNHAPHRRLASLSMLDDMGAPVVAVETRNVALGPEPISLWGYNHPADAIYLFGPHNGIPRGTHCGAHLYVPADLDVRDAISAVLLDRYRKG